MKKLLRIFLALFLMLAIPAESIGEPTPVSATQSKKRKGKGKKTSAVKKGEESKVEEAPKPKKPERTPVVRGEEILRLKAKKDGTSKLYGYENVGDRYYWWAEAHFMGTDKDQLNQGHSSQWIISPQYTRVSKEFSEGLAAVELNGQVGFIDESNRFIIPPAFEPMDDLSGFRYGLAVAKKDGKYGFINKKGEFVIAPGFDGAENFGDDYLAVVKMGKKFGCIDLRGDTVVGCDYIAKEIMKTLPVKNKPYREASKLARQRMEEGYYESFLAEVKSVAEEVDKVILNPNLTEKAGNIEPANGYAVGDGLYIVADSNGLVGVSDTYGRCVLPPVYEKVVYDATQRLLLVEAKAGIASPNSGVGIATTSGGWIIPPVFTTVGNFDSNGYAPVTVGRSSGTVDVFGMVDEELLTQLLESSLQEQGTDYTKRLIGILPTCAPAHNNLGIYYASEQDNLKDAIHHFTVAHRLSPDNETFKDNMKAAKSTRNNRRWNRVMTGLSIAATVVSLGAMTYSVAKGVPLDSSSLGSSGGDVTSGGGSGGGSSKGGKSVGGGKCSQCQGSGTCSPRSYGSRKNACHGSGLCGHCNGTGWLQAGSGQADCPQCDHGECKTCKGSGKCQKCKGTGRA